MDNITFDLKEDCGSVYKTASDDPDLEETPIKQNLFEFDPLLSDKKVNDWMISFESPKPNPVAPALESSNLIDVDVFSFNLAQPGIQSVIFTTTSIPEASG